VINGFLSAGMLLLSLSQAPVPGTTVSQADAFLAELKAGNKRFIDGQRTRSLQSAEDPKLRETLAKAQNPQAVIITCSDSRVVDNFIFDQGLGSLFTIRVAGNCPDPQVIASAEYAVKYLGCQIVIVLGHTSCGAVKAVAEAKGALMPGNLWVFQATMAGLLESTPQKQGEEPSAYHSRLAEANAIRQCAALIQRSEALREKVVAGKVKVVPAVYDLASGRVTFLGE